MKNKYLSIIVLMIISLSFVSAFNFEGDGVKIISPLSKLGNMEVEIQAQTTRPIDVNVYQIINNSMSLQESPTIGSYDLNLTEGHGVLTGQYIAVLEQNGMPHLLYGEVLNVAGTIVTIDTPVPFTYIPEDTRVFTYTTDMTVDGSTDTQIFQLTNYFDKAIDITRVIYHCTDLTSMDDGLYCGRSELTRGAVLRKKSSKGDFLNYWNVKNNGDWGELAYDKEYDAKAPSGEYGMTVRLTYGGQDKHGVVIRLEPNESIQYLIQDDLTGLVKSELMIQGHFVRH